MTEQTAITVLGGSTFIGPAASLAQFRERYQVFNSFVKENLRDKVDFQTIPGTDKPSLVKPGAEKLCALFGLSARFTVASIVEDWTGADHGGEPFFYYRYRCILYRGDLLVSECEGSCNSWEKKYRYRQADLKCPKCGKTTIIAGKKEYGGGWLCFGKKGGCGAKFPDTAPEIVSQPRGQVANTDIADVVNTLQKMAQKRAFVGATLIATNASEYFTQDTEDMPQFVEAEIVEVQTTQPAPKPTAPAAPVVVEAPAPAVQPQAAPKPQTVNIPAMNPVNQATIEAFTGEPVAPAAVVTMTLEDALNIASSDGELYGNIPTEKLTLMANSITRKNRSGNPGTPEEVAERNRKYAAIDIILAHRQAAQ